MTHTAACNIRSPAYRHKTNTAAPSISAAENVMVKTHHLLSGIACGRISGRCQVSKLRGCLRRSQRARNRHFWHLPVPYAASAPHAHCRPLRHPFNLRPMLITSCQRSLAFCKVRSVKNAASPDTIGSGNTAFPFRAAPRHIPQGQGRPVFIQLACLARRAG